MADEETTTPSVDPGAAIASFMEWLQNREQLVGPFSSHYNAEAGNALVKQFCTAQGWTLEDAQVEQVKSLREKYPE